MAKKKPFIPTRNGDKSHWAANYKDEIPAYALSLLQQKLLYQIDHEAKIEVFRKK
jgi:hypothetical protein